uniref:Cdc45 n=2 Tax=Ciona intestinalis TaxID=7719 RepID=Q9NDQ2_CIOIN|nr:cdc45 protein [Ciona intestinalis]BAB00625.1 cdc45 [Ciona intestinalis]|eukprot:NP_001027604.1 cdc45 protein [Ciona intestinalis]
MLITDPVKDFFQKIIEERVLVMVAQDVDGLCACKILQSLFKCDHVQYTLVPVEDKQDLVTEFDSHKEQYKHMVLLNCGGSIDLLEILEPDDDVMIYVIDSRRPIDLVNFYCERQVYLILKQNQEEAQLIPDYDHIYRNYDSDNEDSDTEYEQSSKRHKFDQETLEKKREKRIWEEKRKEIIFDYEEYSYYGTSAALILYELAWKMSKDDITMLWWAIIGVTSQYQNKKIGREKYISSVLELQGHLSRLNHREEDNENTTSIDSIKINFEHDLDIALYRHWSLFESLCHSLNTGTTFKVWTNLGMKRLHQFLAEMGIPLTQCKQSFAFMETKTRDNLQTLVQESAEKFGLRNIKFHSFTAQCGFNHKLCASDVVFSVDSILTNTESSKPESYEDNSNFVDALEGLSRITSPKLEEGLQLAKVQLRAIKNNVGSFIDIGQVLSYGPFLYTNIKEGSPDCTLFAQPLFLVTFSHFLLHSYMRSLGKSKRDRARNLPLVICSPSPQEGSTMVVGIPPLSEESRKNLFGNAFHHASERTKSRTQHHFFNPAIITVVNEDRSKFIDALITIMS